MNRKTAIAAVLLMTVFCVFAGHQYDHCSWNGGNVPSEPVPVSHNRLYLNESVKGTDSFMVLSNSLNPHLPLTMILTRNGQRTSYDLTAQLAELKNSGSNILHAGVTFERGDVVQFAAGNRQYQVYPVGRWDHWYYNPAYGQKHYYELTFPPYCGKLDVIFIKADVPTPNPGTTGQPLPGTVATLLAGGGLAYLIRRRRAKAVSVQ